jgi:predicted phosphodiesterase
MKQFLIKSITMFSIIFITFNVNAFSQNITKGPYLVVSESNSTIVRWETDMQTNGVIKYGIDCSMETEKIATLRGEKNDHYLYEVTIDNLKQDSEYYYIVLSDNYKTEIQNFTIPSDTNNVLRFVAMGDSRSNPEIFDKIIQNVEAEAPSLIISMGDLVENGGNYDQWNDYYFSVADELIGEVPLVSTLGDHEGDGDNGELFRHYLRTTQSTEKQWFSFDYGDAHFISLDYRHPDSKEMIDWFIRDIAISKEKWNFVYMHRPCYNLGGHRSTWGREFWPNLFSEYNIDIVFSGHSHIYERFFPIKDISQKDTWPVTYITTGGAGAGLYDASESKYLAEVESTNHFVSIELIGDTLKAETIRNDGSFLDKFTFIKGDSKIEDKYVNVKEEIDNYTMFTSAISSSIEPIPLNYYPGEINIEFISSSDKSIPFKVQLSDKSSDSYIMEPIFGTLDSDEIEQLSLKIYTNTDITISPWGDIMPELILQAIYIDQFGEHTTEGATIGYWPDEEDY